MRCAAIPGPENCLAEGRRWAETNRAEAAKELKENPEFFTEGRRYVRGDYEMPRWSDATSASSGMRH